MAGAGTSKSLEAVLTEASQMLSGLTRSAGVVLTAKTNVRLKHVEFVRLEPERALAVMVAEDGQVENRVLNIPAGLPIVLAHRGGAISSTPASAARRWLSCGVKSKKQSRKARRNSDQLTTEESLQPDFASWSGGESDERQLIVRGHANLLEDLHALEDLERVCGLCSMRWKQSGA